MAELCRRYDITILVGLAERSVTGKGLNKAIVLNNRGERIAAYDKMHPFSLGDEPRYFDRGDQTVLFDWNGIRVAPFICYDLRFPEIFRDAVFKGADLICVIANWPSKRVHHWTTLLQARAIENQCAVVGVNRCGADPFHVYPGRTLIVDYHGDILSDAGAEECVVSATPDWTAQRDWRKSFPALEDAFFIRKTS